MRVKLEDVVATRVCGRHLYVYTWALVLVSQFPSMAEAQQADMNLWLSVQHQAKYPDTAYCQTEIGGMDQRVECLPG